MLTLKKKLNLILVEERRKIEGRLKKCLKIQLFHQNEPITKRCCVEPQKKTKNIHNKVVYTIAERFASVID